MAALRPDLRLTVQGFMADVALDCGGDFGSRSCGSADTKPDSTKPGVATMDKARAIFETSTVGVMAMTQAVVPQFRVRRSGVIVNVTSSVTLAPMPLVSVYTASKTAIQGFTGSLERELKPFDVRVKLVAPGYGPGARFTENTDVKLEDAIPEPYRPFARPILEAFGRPGGVVTTAQDVAETIWLAGNDRSDQLHWPAGRSGRRGAGAERRLLVAVDEIHPVGGQTVGGRGDRLVQRA